MSFLDRISLGELFECIKDIFRVELILLSLIFHLLLKTFHVYDLLIIIPETRQKEQ